MRCDSHSWVGEQLCPDCENNRVARQAIALQTAQMCFAAEYAQHEQPTTSDLAAMAQAAIEAGDIFATMVMQ